ncbi:hypothetical protein MF672_023725 [Actinomadura sp. ATCC 31491]|uniref:ABC transporter permease n=1 Tax=Actinomadura luzonensis TaxID=2805427 RepID=A0ABT0FWR1_9ACTN|nr:hypothetical protein [Actinomadura luzonensis]MCK2216786.1 hypothetical protein [Actinomadura luzonensis]
MSMPHQLIARWGTGLARARWVQFLLLRPEHPGRGSGAGTTPEAEGQPAGRMLGPENDRHANAWKDVRRLGVVWLAYAFTARNLVRLSVPALLVFLPLGMVAASALVAILDGSVALVNGGFDLIGSPGVPVLRWSAAVLAATVAGQMVVLPATTMIAAGRLVGRNVPALAAVRAAARRWPAMLALVLVGVVVIVADLSAGFGILMWNGAQVPAYAATVLLLLFSLPCLLAVPGVVLGRRSARSALALAYRLTFNAPWATALTLAFGVVLFPALIQQVLQWATSTAPVLQVGTAFVLGLLAVPFQASVIARLFLHRLALAGMIAELREIADELPPSAPRRVRPVLVLAAFLAPSLLYGGAALVNPLGWLEVSETTVTANLPHGSGDEVPEVDGRSPRPSLGSSDLRALYAGPGGHLVMLLDDSREAKLLTCADIVCARPRLFWAEPPAVDGEGPAVSAQLADGRVAVTTWAVDEQYRYVYDENWRARLGLQICDATACAPAPGGKPLAEVGWGGRNKVLALAARPAGGLVVAQLNGLPAGSDADEEELSLTTCDDPACTRPRMRKVAKVPVNTRTGGGRDIIAAVAHDDRPVVLRLDQDNGAIHLVSCGDPACTRASVEQPVGESQSGYPFDRGDRPHAEMAIRADGRPLIAYDDGAEDGIKLLDCRTRTCSQADTATLTSPDERPAGLAMVVDRAGRASVAFQELGRKQIILATCTGTRCTRTPVTTIRGGGDHGLTVTLDDRDRPVLAWMDRHGDDQDLLVTVPLTL